MFLWIATVVSSQHRNAITEIPGKELQHGAEAAGLL
jgi:hypothetical protein